MAQALRTQIGNRSKYSNQSPNGLGGVKNNLTATDRYISLNAIRGQCNLDNSNPNGLSGIYDIHTWACFRDLKVRKLIFKDDKRFKESLYQSGTMYQL